MSRVAIIGVGQSEFVRAYPGSVRELAFEGFKDAMRDARLTTNDYLVWIGSGDDRQLVRLVKLYYQGQWYEYLTNEMDPHLLPAPYVAALYGHRWRLEDAFNTTKRLLVLAYFWTGSQNGVELQLWTTWMVYMVLLDLSDAVAEALHKPLLAISMEMVYRSLSYFGRAYAKGEADDPVA